MDLIITIFILTLILGLVVFIHEFGHFFAAKKSGVVVEEFAFGFGPKIFSKLYKETLYRVNLIPLGGYVKMLGDQDGSSLKRYTQKQFSKEDKQFILKILKSAGLDLDKDSYFKIKECLFAEQKKLDKKDKLIIDRFFKYDYIPNHPGNFDNIKLLPKLAILTAGVFMNFVLGTLIFYILFASVGHEVTLNKIGSPKFLGADTYQTFPFINNIFNDKYQDLQGSIIIKIEGNYIVSDTELRAILNQKYNQEINLTVLNEQGLIETKAILNGDGILSNLDFDAYNGLSIGDVDSSLLAGQQTSLEVNNILLSFAGNKIVDIDQLIELRDQNRGKTIEIEFVDAQGQIKKQPIELPAANGEQVSLGLRFFDKYYQDIIIVDYSNNQFLSGFLHSVNMINYNVSGFTELIKISIKQKSITPVSSSLGSIVAVADITYSLVKFNDATSILNLTGLLNIALALMNILPIPLLDGGHVAILLFEKARGRKISDKTKERISSIAFVFLIALSIIIILKDIVQLNWLTRAFAKIVGLFS